MCFEPLQHFTENDIAQAQLLLAQGFVQQIGLGGDYPVEIVDPDRGINDPHARTQPFPGALGRARLRDVCKAMSAHSVQVAFPVEFAAQRADLLLLLRRTRVHSASSITAFFVESPVTFMAEAINVSSITTLVRIIHLTLPAALYTQNR